MARFPLIGLDIRKACGCRPALEQIGSFATLRCGIEVRYPSTIDGGGAGRGESPSRATPVPEIALDAVAAPRTFFWPNS